MSAPVFGSPVTNPYGLADVGSSASPSFVDIDGDGDFDLFIGSSDGTTVFYRNIGTPSAPAFVSESDNFGLGDVGSNATPTFIDIDNDGDLDAFVGDKSGNTRFFKNTGTASAPAFSSQSDNLGLVDIGSFSKVAFADIDGDDDPDAFVSELLGGTRFFRNIGTASAAVFTSESSNFGLGNVPTFAKVTLLDFDGDQDFDAFIGDTRGLTTLNRNLGTMTAPSFVSDSGTQGIIDVRFQAVPAFADLDNDNDPDALIGNQFGNLIFFENLNPKPGVTLTESNGSTKVAEGGTTDTYTLVLNAQPATNVTITLVPVNQQVTTSYTNLVFTPENWNVPQSVTVHAVDDTIGEGPHVGVIQHVLTSTDAGYDGLVAPALRVAITDNDIPARAPIFDVLVTNPFGLPALGDAVAVAVDDVNADGRLDLLVSNEAGDLHLFANAGTASAPLFENETPGTGLLNVGGLAIPTFGDLDGDGLPDLVVGKADGDFSVFRNITTASGVAFTPIALPPGLVNVGSNAAPALADIDDDKDLDLFVGRESGGILFLRNDGTATAPTFTTEAGNFGLPTSGISIVPTIFDLDGDGDFDFLAGDGSGNFTFHRNTGTASSPAFTLETTPRGLTATEGPAAPALADLNSDGTPDVLVVNGGNARFGANLTPRISIERLGFDGLAEGGGSVLYTLRLASPPTANVVITLSNNQQVVSSETTLTLTSLNWREGQNVSVSAVDDQVLEGTQFGVIKLEVTSADPDYDGYVLPPLVLNITDNDFPAFLPSFGTPVLNPAGLVSLGPKSTPAFADFNGDALPDMVAGQFDGTLKAFVNTGTQTAPAFEAVPGNLSLGDVGYYSAPVFADLDNDGDYDLVAGKGDGETDILLNVGTFAVPEFISQSGNFGLADVGDRCAPAVGDLDGDGDPDFLLGNFDGFIQFWRNDGTPFVPAYTLVTTSLGFADAGSSAKPAVADLDGDGLLDVVVGNAAGHNAFYKNIGTATSPLFTPLPGNYNLLRTDYDAAPTFVDLDGNRSFDAVVGSASGPLRFFPNTPASNIAPTLGTLVGLNYTDTRFDDIFPVASGTLVGIDADGNNVFTYGIEGGIDNGTVVSLTSPYGQLSVVKATGEYSFVPNDPEFEAFIAAFSGASFTMTVSDGTDSGSATLSLDVAQVGGTESNGNDVLIGTAGADRFNALGGNDVMQGLGGNDVLNGGTGLDTAVYLDATGAVTVTLARAGPQNTKGAGTDTLIGIENLTGSRFADTLTGNSAANVLAGERGADRLTGGPGKDRFEYFGVTDSPPSVSGGDTLTDFSHAQGDRIDLLDLDANTGVSGNQAFTKLVSSSTPFSAKKSFTAPAQLYYDQAAGVLYGNVDADKAAEFSIKLLGVAKLMVSDFIL